AGGGGLGDPLKRNPASVLEDVIDNYVSVERAKKDYGVIIEEIDKELDQFEINEAATKDERDFIRTHRKSWLQEDTKNIYELYQSGKVDKLDLIRRYGVILDYETDSILEKSTAQYRESMEKRTVPYWD